MNWLSYIIVIKKLPVLVTESFLIFFKGFNYTTPCAIIASATFTKPAMLAPFT
jgi:hypothetical protein